MANREVDMTVRYVVTVVDRGVAKAIALTKDFGKASEQAGAVVAKSAKLQQAQWQAVARVAEVADVKVATSAIKASVEVSKATEHTINALRKQGVAYEEIAAKQRAAGTSAGELASAMEAASRREIAAMERVRAVADKPIRQRISEGASTARGGATRFVGGLAAAGGSLALAGTAAAGSVAYASYEKASKVTEDAYRLRGQTGVSQQQALQLAIIAQSQHDLPTRTLGMSFATASTQLQKALQGQAQNKPNASQLAFKQLGISPQQAAGMQNNIPGLVDLLHGRLSGLHNQTQQAQLGRTFFGRGASQLGPLFKEGPISKHMEEIGKQTGGLSPADMQKMNVEVVKLNEQVTLFELKFIKAFGPEIRAAISLAAKAIGPVGSAFTAVFKVIEGVLKGPVGQALAGFGKQVFSAGKQLVEAFKPALPLLKNVLLPLLKGVAEGVATGIIATIKVATRVVQFFAPVLGSIGTAAKPLKPLIEDVGKVIGFVFGPGLLGKIASSLKAVGGVLPVVGKGVELLAVPFQAVGKAMGVLKLPAAALTLGFGGLKVMAVTLATGLLGMLVVNKVKAAFVAMKATVKALRVSMAALNILNAESKIRILASTAAMVAQRVATAAGTVAWIAWGAAQVAGNTVMAVFNSRIVASTVAMVARTAAFVAQAAVMFAIAGATRAWAIAQLALDVALNANPIGLLVAGIGLLVVGLVEAYKHSKTFRDIVQGAMSAVVTAANTVVGFFKDNWPQIAALLTAPFAPVISLAEQFGPQILGAFTGAFNSVESFLVGLPGTFANLGKSIIGGLVSGIQAAPSAIVDAIKGLLPGPLQGALGTIVGGGSSAFGSVVNFLGGREGGVIPFANGGLVPALVSSGEQVIHQGRAMTVPGARVAADNVFAMLPHGAAVMTDHGQHLMAAGHTMDEALSMQMPHFATGGWALPGAGRGGHGHGRARHPRAAHPRAAHHTAFHRPHELTITGPVSTFGPPGEAAGQTAYGGSSSQAGIALNPSPPDGWNSALAQSLAGKLFRVAIGAHSAVLKVIDKGPHAQGSRGWRQIDVTGAGARLMGINPAQFPTDQVGRATMVVGGVAKATKALTAKQLKAAAGPTLANKTGLDPMSALQTGFDAGLKGDALSSTSAVSDAIKAAAVKIPGSSPGGIGPSAPSPFGNKGRAPRSVGGSAYDRMVAEANQIASRHYNYEWGGGHNSAFAPTSGSGHGSGPGIGYDCSGSVSAVLRAGRALSSPLDSTGLMSYGQPGRGRVSIYASPTHTVMSLGGRFFGTSNANRGGGAGWLAGQPESFPATRHPPGLRRGGRVGHHRRVSRPNFAAAGASVARMGLPPSMLTQATKDFGVLAKDADSDVSGKIGRTLTRIGSLVSKATMVQLDRTVTVVQAGLHAHGLTAIGTRRLQSALAIVDAQIGNRLGLMAHAVQDTIDKVAKHDVTRQQWLRIAAVDSSSSLGLTSEQGQNSLERVTLQAAKRHLEQIRQVAKRHHAPEGGAG